MSEMPPEPPAPQPAYNDPAPVMQPAYDTPLPAPALGVPGCPTCGLAPAAAAGIRPAGRYVYALGRIEPRFPNIGVEKELAQAVGHAHTVGLSDREVAQQILSDPANMYIARELCWTFTIGGVDAYVLAPRDASDVQLLIGSLRPVHDLSDVDIVVGTIGPPAPAWMCNGVQLPTVLVAQIYSFDVDSFISGLGAPDQNEGTRKEHEERAERFARSSTDVLQRVLLLAGNTGTADEHRALNYLATRTPAAYEAVFEMHHADASLEAVGTRLSPLSDTRTIVEVIFTFRNRQSDVAEKRFARVDVTELFPFLVSKMAPYYDIQQ